MELSSSVVIISYLYCLDNAVYGSYLQHIYYNKYLYVLVLEQGGLGAGEGGSGFRLAEKISHFSGVP